MRDWLIGCYAHSLENAKQLTGDIECADCAHIEGGVSKHPAWVLGHLTVGGDMLVGLAGGERRHADWDPLYMPGAEPSADRSMYPKKDELLGALAERHAALTEVIRSMDDAEMNAAFPIEEYRSFWPTMRDAAGYMMACHEPYHLGQLTQWRKACGIKTVPAF